MKELIPDKVLCVVKVVSREHFHFHKMSLVSLQSCSVGYMLPGLQQAMYEGEGVVIPIPFPPSLGSGVPGVQFSARVCASLPSVFAPVPTLLYNVGTLSPQHAPGLLQPLPWLL